MTWAYPEAGVWQNEPLERSVPSLLDFGIYCFSSSFVLRSLHSLTSQVQQPPSPTLRHSKSVKDRAQMFGGIVSRRSHRRNQPLSLLSATLPGILAVARPGEAAESISPAQQFRPVHVGFVPAWKQHFFFKICCVVAEA